MKATTPAKKAKKVTHAPKKHAAKQNTKVNIYPNRMSLAVAALAAVSLALFGLMMTF